MNHFGRTGSKRRPRIRKFHAELLLAKFMRDEKVLCQMDLKRPKEYINRMVKFSKGWLEFINADALEMQLTEHLFEAIGKWQTQYSNKAELDTNDKNLEEQGIIVRDDGISFDGRLIYSKFHKIVSDESEAMNDPRQWIFNTKNILAFDRINFGNKSSPAFSSRLFLLKFYILRKIDEVAFVTSRFVQCPNCNANYVVPSAKIDFQKSYKCENKIGDKICKTLLKKFPARKMIPTYIYEVSIEVSGTNGAEFKEFFLESFIDLTPGFYNGMVFGRTENKTNAFYFTCLTAKAEKSKVEFSIEQKETDQHAFFTILNSVLNHIKKVGFIIDQQKARLPMMIELLKKLTLVTNKEINLDHSLYFGAPGIGKTYALTLLHYMFYSNAGFISGPRFTLPGLTGGQKEILYQDSAKKKNVPGLFSNQAFLFDEINNAQFLADDKAINLFKSVALAASGTASTVGGKEFPRVSLIAGTANYDINYLKHYENKIKKIYNSGNKTEEHGMSEQSAFINKIVEKQDTIPPDFDFYAPLRSYQQETPKDLKLAILKVRDESKSYLTGFPKPLMERFYWSILVHPKYDSAFMKQKKIEVLDYLKARKSRYSQRELFSQLYVSEFESIIKTMTKDARMRFNDIGVEANWSYQAREFLDAMAWKYPHFFSMFQRVNQVHVFHLYTLTILNGETELSFASKRIFERLISLSHTPIEMKDFHNPDFDKFHYLGETRGELLHLIKRYKGKDIREFVDFEGRQKVRKVIVDLLNNKRIKKVDDFFYEIDDTPKFEEIKNEDRKN